MKSSFPTGARLAVAAGVLILLADAARAAGPMAAPDSTVSGTPATVLDLAGALRMAATRSQAAAQADADIAVAQSDVDKVRARWWPSLTFGAQYTVRDNPVEAAAGPFVFPMNQKNNGQYDLTAREVLWDGGKRGLAISAAREGERAARASGEASVRDAQLSVLESYLTAQELAGRSRVLQKRLDALQSHLGTVKDLLGQGLVARNDVLETEVRVREVEDATHAVANARAVALADLNRKLGRAPQTPVSLPDSLPPTPDLSTTRDSLAAAAARDNASLRAADARLAASQTAARLAGRAWTPNFYVALSHSYQENETLVHPHVNAAVAGVSWDVFDGGARKADERAAAARVLAASRARLEASRAVSVAVDAAWRGWRQALREEETARANVSAAVENLRIVEDQYRNGLARSADALDAEALLADARLAVLTRHHATYRAQAQLLAAAGTDLITFYSSSQSNGDVDTGER